MDADIFFRYLTGGAPLIGKRVTYAGRTGTVEAWKLAVSDKMIYRVLWDTPIPGHAGRRRTWLKGSRLQEVS